MIKRSRLDALIEAGQSTTRAVRLSSRTVCVLDPITARQILRGQNDAITDHSDFFGRPGEAAPTRNIQRAIARGILRLLSIRVARLRQSFPIKLPERSAWPDMAFALIYESLGDVLVGRERPDRLKRAFASFVRKAIMPEQKTMWNRMRALRLSYAVLSIIRSRSCAAGAREPRDVLDVIMEMQPALTDDETLRVFFSAVFSTIQSLSLALTWAVYYAVGAGRGADPMSVVRESMRRYPVAWALERHVASEFVIDDVVTASGDTLLISPYLLHRTRNGSKNIADESVWLPFGLGPHRCPAGSFSLILVQTLLERLPLDQLHLVEGDALPPLASAVLRPASFALQYR